MSQSPRHVSQKKHCQKVGTRDESEGEEMVHDSDSDKGSGSDNESSSNRSDSEDSSSGMDEDEVERRRDDILQVLPDLERQFTILRELLYRERFAQVDSKLFEIRSGRAQEYLLPLAQLQDNMRIRTEVAAVLKQFSIASAEMQYLAENAAAKQHLESEQKLLKDRIREDIENEIRRLEEDRNNIDVSSALWGKDPPKKSGSRKKPISVSGPYIVYMLADEDILSDLTIIKKALAAKR